MLASTRRGIVYPNTNRTDSADVPRDIAALVAALEIDVIYGQGTLAARPTSTPGSPGVQGRIYMATDQTPHVLYYDYGTGWDSVGAIAAGSIGTTQLADLGVTTAKLADLGVTTGKLADLGVTSGKLAPNAVTPAKMDLTQIFDFTAAGGLKAQGKRVHRHPYAGDRHIESGTVNFGSIVNGSSATASVTYTAAGASGSRPVASPYQAGGGRFGVTGSAESATASGFTAVGGNLSGVNTTVQINWIADIF